MVSSGWFMINSSGIGRFTVTSHVVEAPPGDVAVITVEPALRAVTTPFFTVATDSLEEVHARVRSLTSAGVNVAVSVVSSPG